VSTPTSAGGPAVEADRWLVVGLGNPGPAYAGNRHNAGFLVLDVLAGRLGGRFRPRGRADVLEGRLGGTTGGPRLVLAKPRSFMNESGGPVAAVRSFFSVPIDHVLVVHDELDLPYGVLRVKVGGGDNGHNGLRSLRRSLGSGDFARVRIGIGRPPGRQDPADYVLRDFAASERMDLDAHVETAADAVESLLTSGLAATQTAFNA